MGVEKDDPQQNHKYPKSVFFIVCNEFCERFAYYGNRTILVLYLRNKLGYDDDSSTIIYHIFCMFAYFFPLFGAMIADSWLGKFRTILYVSIIYVIGQLILTGSAIPLLNLPTREFALLGLALIAIGTGGIKPCVSAFGGDQFVLPQQQRQLIMFFSMFYFAINTGSLISTFTTPILRQDVSCFGENTCYSLAFFVPGLLMLLSIVIVLLGKPLYKIRAPEGNVVLEVGKCITHAIGNKLKAKKGEEREHWLDYADDKYDPRNISDIRSAFAVLKMFLPLPVYWALADQQGSRWTIQATRMDGQIGSFLLKPDQMQVLNPLLIIILIPIFESCIYPILAKLRLVRTALQKMTVGGILTAVAFIISALVELKLETTYAVTPSAGLAQVRIFNTLNCPINMRVGNESFVLDNLSVWENKYVQASGDVTLNYTANYAECYALGMTPDLNGETSGTITGVEATAISWVVDPTGINHNYTDSVAKTRTGDPAVRALVYLNETIVPSVELKFVENAKTVLSFNVSSTPAHTALEELDPGTYDIYLNEMLVRSSVPYKLGGIYTVTAYINSLDNAAANSLTITDPNSMHMLWLIPQYTVLTIGEVLFSVTGLEFAFTQAPLSMKSLLTAAWLLTTAFGNLIVVIVTEVSLFSSQASEFFLFAGLMLIDMLLFAVMAMFYKYAERPKENPYTGTALEGKNGTVNPSFKGDDET